MQLTALLLVLASWVQLSQAFLLNFDDNGIYVKRQISQSDVIDRSVTSNVQPKPYLMCRDGLMRTIEANVIIPKPQYFPRQLTPWTARQN
jgi:hypothetical protein